MAPPTFAACTVVAKNHLAYARVLAASFNARHPGTPFVVLLADRSDGLVETQREPFQVLEIEALDIPDSRRVCFQYSAFELSCAAKPFLLRALFDQHGFHKLVYLDADLLLVGDLTAVVRHLDDWSIVLSPHLLTDIAEDGRRPSAREVIDVGVFNGGLFAVRNDGPGRQFLDWLAARLRRDGLFDVPRGLNCDQRWLSLAPGLFDGVHVMRDPGHNVGYWRLARAHVEVTAGRPFIEGQPLESFHFSGLPLEDVARVSRHQDRLTLADLPELTPLFEDYRDQVLAAGGAECLRWPYAFGAFDNGVPIPAQARRLYWSLGDTVERFGDPFRTRGRDTVWRFLNEETHPGSPLSRLWYHVYLSRPDVQQTWPDVLGADAAAVRQWIESHGRAETGLGQEFTLPPACSGLVPAALVAPAAPHSRTRPSRALGVNVVGHAMSEKGIGEGLRANVRALAAAGVPHCVVDFADPGSTNNDRTLASRIRHHPFETNIIHVNADALPYFVSTCAPGALRGRYNIGVWMWELSEFPAIFRGSFAYVDEVWVPSAFCLDALSRSAAVPVVRVPLALPERIEVAAVDRTHFGLPSSACLFLFAFDVASILERKNPAAVIRAFRRAFGAADDAVLALKLAHGTRRVRQQLEAEAGDARVVILDSLLDRPELNALISLCDCYVSLHRSEGFGFTIAEAMALGKPVIATGYSGNMDFMTPANSFPVSYRLVKLETDLGPYRRGSFWAEPDLEEASGWMRRLFESRDLARRTGARARETIWQQLSPAVVGGVIRARLELVGDL